MGALRKVYAVFTEYPEADSLEAVFSTAQAAAAYAADLDGADADTELARRYYIGMPLDPPLPSKQEA